MNGKINRIKFLGQIIFAITLLLYCCGCASNIDEQSTEYLEPIQDFQQQSNVSEDANDVYINKTDILKNELKVLSERMENHRKTLDGLAQSYGTLDLSSQQNLMSEHIKTVLTKLTETEFKRIELEIKIAVLQSKPDKTQDQEQKIEDIQLELEITRKFEEQLRVMLKRVDNEAINTGRRQLMINEFQNRLEKDNQKYDSILQSIQKMESAGRDSQI